jgi:hypothetical protein
LYRINEKRPACAKGLFDLKSAATGLPPGTFCTLLDAITPPPRQTSPWYSTADWPGVTAHWGAGNTSSQPPAEALASSQAASSWR